MSENRNTGGPEAGTRDLSSKTGRLGSSGAVLIERDPLLPPVRAMAFCKLFSVLVLIHNTGGLLGGQDAPKGRWPWMIHLNITSDGVNRWRCGGTILDNQWVLTAAHCFDDNLKPNLRRSMVWAGSHELQKGFHQYMGIRTVVMHSQYGKQGNRYINDIALVKLTKPLKLSDNIKALKLPSNSDNFSPSSECWITGWGNTDNDVPLRAPEPLQELKINIVSQAECQRHYPGLTSDMLCAGGYGRGAGKGDYGGPLVCRTDKDFVQVGIISYGSADDCGLQCQPDVYTRVSTYLHFIYDYIHDGNSQSGSTSSRSDTLQYCALETERLG
ncbi:tryptase-2-like isoform X2 [Anabas testudineus]|uniref:Peptidase S1 domain-containing protein n=2 Tax=Anabas testudineus TaxID=64144 RepID=A0A3Q1I078_ANATE|nr:tryptase-2-like isoform X2 [Anabas testudineus]XP_026214586.1 tryptase-2-like isoform X2 [Anabas testudineus]